MRARAQKALAFASHLVIPIMIMSSVGMLYAVKFLPGHVDQFGVPTANYNQPLRSDGS